MSRTVTVPIVVLHALLQMPKIECPLFMPGCLLAPLYIGTKVIEYLNLFKVPTYLSCLKANSARVYSITVTNLLMFHLLYMTLAGTSDWPAEKQRGS